MNLKFLCIPINQNSDGTFTAKCPICGKLSLHIDKAGNSPGCANGCDPKSVEAGCADLLEGYTDPGNSVDNLFPSTLPQRTANESVKHSEKYRAPEKTASPTHYEKNEFNEKRSGKEGVNSLNSLNSYSQKTESLTTVTTGIPPDPLDEAALIGLAGEFVRLIEPHTESDPVAILVQFLLAFGTVIDRNAFAKVEASEHYMNEFAVLVGQSAKGRKGTSAAWVRRAFEYVAPDWGNTRILGGLSSGEGLIWAVRDQTEKQEPIKEKGVVVRYQTVIDDPGEEDKRLFVLEEEFARALTVMNRESNILSSILRQAWDTGILRVMTKQPYKATDAHISIIGHITCDELRRLMTDTAKVNGFANRFLWIVVKRSKELPEGGTLREQDLYPLFERLRQAIEFGNQVRCLERDDEARKAWCAVYPKLTREVPGLLGSVTSRADPHVLRLSCLYALLDRSEMVRLKHLKAALALWEYSEQSARYIFGDALGDPVADAILKGLRDSQTGMTRTEISNVLGRNHKAERITQALSILQERKLAHCEQAIVDGRSSEIWKALGTGQAVSTSYLSLLPPQTYEKYEFNEYNPVSDGNNSLNSLNSYAPTEKEIAKETTGTEMLALYGDDPGGEEL